jgi:sulfur carrier protein ThiS
MITVWTSDGAKEVPAPTTVAEVRKQLGFPSTPKIAASLTRGGRENVAVGEECELEDGDTVWLDSSAGVKRS